MPLRGQLLLHFTAVFLEEMEEKMHMEQLEGAINGNIANIKPDSLVYYLFI